MNFKSLGYDTMSTELLDDAYQALQDSKLEEWFVQYNPPEDKGFMFANEPHLETINKHMKLMSSHSGFSYGWTMRTLQYELRKQPKHLLNTMIKEGQQSPNPEIQKQADALNDFKEGKISYAEMRMLCG